MDLSVQDKRVLERKGIVPLLQLLSRDKKVLGPSQGSSDSWLAFVHPCYRLIAAPLSPTMPCTRSISIVANGWPILMVVGSGW